MSSSTIGSAVPAIRACAAAPRAACGVVLSIALLLLAGCDRNDPRTAGQKLDAAIATTEQKLEGLKGEARTAGKEARETAARIGDKVEDASSDAGITTKVKTRLATDAQLNALKIDVDTHAGRVTLSGTVASTAARTKATELASGVEGVVAVDNRLTVGATP